MYLFLQFAFMSVLSFVCLSYGTSISKPTLTLLNNNYETYEPIYEYNAITDTTLKHELIHAMQHCRGEWQEFRHLLDKKSLIFCIYNKLVNVDFIDKYYSDADYFIEIDAYCLEKLVTYDIINLLLDRYCGIL